MPSFSGNFEPYNVEIALDPYTSANLFSARDYYTGDVRPANYIDGVLGSSSSSHIVPAPYHTTFGGSQTVEFIDDWYYRIHIIPNVLDLGNVVSSQSRDIYVWNAYLTSKPFDDLVIANNDGITLEVLAGSAPPTTMRPLALFHYRITIDVNGPPTIGSTVTWTIGTVTYTLTISGRRLILFPFKPNWDQPVDETLEAKSTVFRAYDGTEQTTSLRNKLRRIYEYSIALRINDAQRFDNLLFGWQDRLYGLPAWPERSSLQADVAAGDLTIMADTQYKTYKVGGLVALYTSPSLYEVREIADVVGDSITLTAPLDYAWKAGSSVYPVFPASLDESVSGSRITDGVLTASVRLTCEPSGTDPNLPGVAAPLTYLGDEMYLEKTNWLDGMSMSWTTDRERFDHGTGKFYSYPRAGFSTYERRHSWLLASHSEVYDFRGFLERRKGRAVPVYMPSGTIDFTLAANVVAADVSIDVEPNEYESVVDANPARRDLIIQFRDGTYLAFRIGASAVTEEGLTRLTFSVPIGRNFTPAEVKRISVLHYYRLSADAVTIRWQANGKAISEAVLTAKKTY